jgi:hypothetical protein
MSWYSSPNCEEGCGLLVSSDTLRTLFLTGFSLQQSLLVDKHLTRSSCCWEVSIDKNSWRRLVSVPFFS